MATLNIPEDIAREIQKYCDGKSILNTRLVNKGFVNPLLDEKNIYHYKHVKNSTRKMNTLPKWITKIKVDKTITDVHLKGCDRLTFLDGREAEFLSDKSISKLVNLETLLIGKCKEISDDSLKSCKKIKNLEIGSSSITNKGLLQLRELKQLNIGNSHYFDCSKLNQTLTNLSIGINATISDSDLERLTNLQKLTLGNSPKIKGNSLHKLIHLKYLAAGFCPMIQIQQVSMLPLECLSLNEFVHKVSDAGPINIPALKELHLFRRRSFKISNLTGHPDLIISTK